MTKERKHLTRYQWSNILIYAVTPIVIAGAAIAGFAYYTFNMVKDTSEDKIAAQVEAETLRRLSEYKPDPYVHDNGLYMLDENPYYSYFESYYRTFFCWITTPDDNLDSLVMRAPEEDYLFYLDHDYVGRDDPAGDTYISGAQSKDDDILIIYGRNNPEKNSVFSVASYSENDFRNDKRTFTIHFADVRREYEIIGVLDNDITPFWNCRNFDPEHTEDSFLNDVLSLSIYESDIPVYTLYGGEQYVLLVDESSGDQLTKTLVGRQVSEDIYDPQVNADIINLVASVGTYETEPSQITEETTFIAGGRSYENVPYGFELPVRGATGYVMIPSDLLSLEDDTTIARLETGEAFMILDENNDTWTIEWNGLRGRIYNANCMINLPDVLPSVDYMIANADSSIYMSSGYSIPGLTGEALYTTDDGQAVGTPYNARLGHAEYIAPVMYSVAKMIASAQVIANEQGYGLIIYDTYRPHSVTTLAAQQLNALYQSNDEVRTNINYFVDAGGNTYSFGPSWFLAQSVSTHNTGSALDVSLINLSSGQEVSMPCAMHELSTRAVKYVNGATYSSNMNDSAISLDQIFSQAGMTGLASEWWHFQDYSTHNRVRSYLSAGATFQATEVLSVRPEDVDY